MANCSACWIFVLFLFMFLLVPAKWFGNSWCQYNHETFLQAQAGGRIIFVTHLYDAAGAAAREFASRGKILDVEAFLVNFDRNKEFFSAHGVKYQTTLVVFECKREMGRSLGDYDKNNICTLILKDL